MHNHVHGGQHHVQRIHLLNNCLPIFNLDRVLTVCHNDYLARPCLFLDQVLILRFNPDNESIDRWGSDLNCQAYANRESTTNDLL